MRILLVDDDEDFIEFMARDLKRVLGTRPHVVLTANAALTYIKKHPVDFLITDTNMPHLNGIDLLVKAKEYDRNLKIIVLFSGLSRSKINAKEVYRLGAFMVVKKSEIHTRLFPLLRAYAIGYSLSGFLKKIFPR